MQELADTPSVGGTSVGGTTQRAALEARLIARAWSDPSQAERLKRDPRGILARELRHGIPRDLGIEVVGETRDRIVLGIPVNPYPIRRGETSPTSAASTGAG